MRLVPGNAVGSFLCVLVFLTAGYCQTPVTWQIEVVNTDGGGEFSSLAIDRFGSFHLVYSTRAGSSLRYVYRPRLGKRWDTTVVDTAGGSFNSLAVDSHGWAHIAYNSPNSTGLHYAYWDGSDWRKFIIDRERTSHQTSIQLDSQGNPRISYYRDAYADRRNAEHLKYAYSDGHTWYTQTVDHRAGTGRWNSIALDRTDRPYISYSLAEGSLGFALLDRSNWEQSLAGDRSSKNKKHLDLASSLVVDREGTPHLAYIDASTRTVNYAWREGPAWHEETLDFLVSTGADGDRVSLRLDGKGQPHVVYNDSGSAVLKYAMRDKEGWHTEIIDRGDAGEYASLSLDDKDQPYVAYYAITDKELRIAHRSLPESVDKK